MADLLKVKGELDPSSSKTHIAYRLLVPGGESLHVHFAYGPKVLEDRERSRMLIEEGLNKYIEPRLLEQYKQNWEINLPLKNLITVSFDDANGFRGSAHRHDPDQHFILAPDEASPGLVKGVITPGVWIITLSVHCIVTEACHYSLRVWEEKRP